MKPSCPQISHAQLQALLLDRAESLESTQVAQHVEQCETCQTNLAALIGADAIAQEASQLLSGYTSTEQNYLRRLPSTSPTESSPTDESAALELDMLLLGAPSHPEMLGRIGRYEIERRIGSGGMGVVFKAIDTELNRPVAIKVLAPHLARSGAARQRFSRESRAAAAVVHEHVVAIHNVDSNVEYPYLVMQFVSGESLQSRVEREGPLSVERILRVGIQAALGLSAAHQQGIVHRDIKPANMLLEDGVDRLLITDFGLARTVDDASLTHTGFVAGTPSYMSPEQATGDEVDHRTDLFSLGSVLYYTATGHPPFRAERAMGVLHRICHERHRPVWQINARIPDELSAVIDRLLEKRPGRRFASATTLAESLTRILHQVQHRRPGISLRLRSWGWRNQSAALAVGLFVLIAVGLGAWAVLSISGPIAWQPMRATGSSKPATRPMMNMANATTDPALEMEKGNPDMPDPFGPPSSSVHDAGQTAWHLPSDRDEFDQLLSGVIKSLQGIENGDVIQTNDSFIEFKAELRSLDEKLKAIDPTVPPKKK